MDRCDRRVSPILAIIICLCAGTVLGQHENALADGFYVIIRNTNQCPKEVTSYNKMETTCISPRPLINASEFVSISEIQVDSVKREKRVIIKLSANGYNSWRGIIKNFPKVELALVVGGMQTGSFKNSDNEIPIESIAITGMLPAPEIDWIVSNLKKTSSNLQKD